MISPMVKVQNLPNAIITGCTVVDPYEPFEFVGRGQGDVRFNARRHRRNEVEDDLGAPMQMVHAK